jgi:AP-4 complex subunit mu-1
MLSQLFILSARGDAVVSRDYRHDVARSSHETLFRCLQQGAGEAEEVPPVFHLDGVNYFVVKA